MDTLEETDTTSPNTISTTTTAATTTMTTTLPTGEAAIGKNAKTPYGEGTVIGYRQEDAMYEVQLHTTTTTNNSTISNSNGNNDNNNANENTTAGTVFTREIQIQNEGEESPPAPAPAPSPSPSPSLDQAMELNVAYGACETMRRLNLEVKCFEAGLGQVDHNACAQCFLTQQVKPSNTSRFPRLQKFVDEATTAVTTTSKSLSAGGDGEGNDSASLSTNTTKRFPRLQKLADNASAAASSAAATLYETPSAPPPPNSTTTSTASTATTSATTTTTTPARFPRLHGLWGKATTAATAATAMVNPTPAAQEPVTMPLTTQNTAAPASTTSPIVTPESSASTHAPVSTNNDPIDTTNSNNNNRTKDKEGATSPTTTQKTVVLPRIQKLLDDREKAAITPCLVCSSPTCPAHSSTAFRKEGITLCQSCERFFELDFIIDCVSTPDAKERAKHIDHMIDLYDRCLMLLRYSGQYIEQIATVLEQNKEQQNRIGLGSSGVGVVSGVLGVAAAATILTPAGPPLLIASLVFGGSATAVQTGSDAMNYFSEPNKLADRILSLHGMLHSLLRVTGTLRDAMLRDHIRTDAYAAESSESSVTEQVREKVEQNRAGVLAASNVGRSLTLGGAATGGAVAGAEAGVVGARSATAFSRAGTAAARTMRFARFAGGALSAAVLVMEYNAIQSTLKSISDGNPCDKATAIRKIAKELEDGHLPTTASLDEECQAYLATMADRTPPELSSSVILTEPVATAVPMEPSVTNAATMDGTPLPPLAAAVLQTTNSDGELLCAPGATILDGDDNEATAIRINEDDQASSSSAMAGSSLLERIQWHRRQPAQSRPSNIIQRQRRLHAQSRPSNMDHEVVVGVRDSTISDTNLDLVI